MRALQHLLCVIAALLLPLFSGFLAHDACPIFASCASWPPGAIAARLTLVARFRSRLLLPLRWLVMQQFGQHLHVRHPFPYSLARASVRHHSLLHTAMLLASHLLLLLLLLPPSKSGAL